MSDYFDSLAARTPARLQIGRAGSRYKTQKYLDFRAAHAAANDAVMTEVSSELLKSSAFSRCAQNAKINMI